MTSEQQEGFRRRETGALILGAIGGAVTYTTCVLAHLPTPRYFPVERVWDLGPHAGTVSMGYYGNLLVSAAVALAAYGLGRIPVVERGLCQPKAARILTWVMPLAVAGCLIAQLIYELARWS